jgi:hypothetical protein
LSVGILDSVASGSAAASQSKALQAKALFDKLGQSIQSGDIAGAQQAFLSFQQLKPFANNYALQKQVDLLGHTLETGDVSGSQQAFAAVQNALVGKANAPAPRGAGAHHGGGGGGASSSKTVVSETSTTSPSGQITTTSTYSDGSKETSTSYGPTPNSTVSVFA